MSQAMTVQQSAAAPYDNRLNGKSQSENTRTDESASRRAEKQAATAQSEAKANQVAKEVLGVESVTDKAQEESGRIDVYA